MQRVLSRKEQQRSIVHSDTFTKTLVGFALAGIALSHSTIGKSRVFSVPANATLSTNMSVTVRLYARIIDLLTSIAKDDSANALGMMVF